jgi:hypothetical protein
MAISNAGPRLVAAATFHADDQGGRDGVCRCTPRRDPACKKYSADADEQPEVDADPRQPDQRVHRACAGRRRRVRGRGADRKHHRSRDRMAVCRYHAVAEDLGAPRQVVRQRDDDALVDAPYRRIRTRPASGIDQADHDRRHRFVEPQLHGLRRQLQYAAVIRLARNQRCMR